MSGGLKLAVLGLGRSGDAVVRWALDRRVHGEVAEVSAYVEHDTPELREAAGALRRAGARVELGCESLPAGVASCDLIVASPGIAPHRPIMRSAASLGVPIVSEMELAFRVTDAPFVAVTGTNGKTTTTALVAHLLNASGADGRACGNIGEPAITAAARTSSDTVLVAECSSFQLSLTFDFRPKVAVLLNITPDHIDWHGSLESYTRDKAKVFARQQSGDTAVIDVDDAGSAPWADTVEAAGVRVVRVSRESVVGGPGAYLADGMLTVDLGDGPVSLVAADELVIRGAHNVSNALAGAAAALAAGASPDAVRHGLRTFQPIEHRMQPIGEIAGVQYVNDSKATNPDATIKAIHSYHGRQLVVLLGGRNKGNTFEKVASACRGRCRTAVLFGEARADIEPAFRDAALPYALEPTMRAALARATAEAREGDVVLLSPACASFDEFTDYEDRGRTFAALVDEMGDAR